MKPMRSKNFHIAGLNFRLQSDIDIHCSDEFRNFESTGNADYSFVFEETETLEPATGTPIACETGFSVFQTADGYLYRYVDPNNQSYAVSRFAWDENTMRVQYLHEGLRYVSHTNGAFFHVRWEDLLLHAKRLILHACCIETEFGGILFSGTSGIGKSTQGQLWCQHENAEVINGDRPVLHKDQGQWFAYGSPYAGSSKCHKNKKTKVRVIVLLAQAKECSIRKLGKAEAFRKTFAQVTLSVWNPDSVNCGCEILEALIEDVPIYELACTPDVRTVELLKKTLEEEGMV